MFVSIQNLAMNQSPSFAAKKEKNNNKKNVLTDFLLEKICMKYTDLTRRVFLFLRKLILVQTETKLAFWITAVTDILVHSYH